MLPPLVSKAAEGRKALFDAARICNVERQALLAGLDLKPSECFERLEKGVVETHTLIMKVSQARVSRP